MATLTYKQKYVDSTSETVRRSKRQGRKKSPVETKSVRVNITLSPQAKKYGKELARADGKTFSAWIESQIYTH